MPVVLESSSLLICRARSLRRDNGTLLTTKPVLLFHPLRVVRMETQLASLSFGPAAALRLPAGVLAHCESGASLVDAIAIWPDDRGFQTRASRRELLPSRVPISLEEFGGLLRVWQGARNIDAVQAVLRWVRRDQAGRLRSRNGHRPSVEAWKKWSAAAASAENALWAASSSGTRSDALPTDCSVQQRRAIARLLGMSIQGGLGEFRRRRLLAVAAQLGHLDDAVMTAAGYKSRSWCERDFEIACGELPHHWLVRHGLTKGSIPHPPAIEDRHSAQTEDSGLDVISPSIRRSANVRR